LQQADERCRLRLNRWNVLEETLMNIASHAYGGTGDGVVELTLAVDTERMTLRFVDSGVDFDPTQVAPSPRPATIAHAEPGGLGLALTRGRALHLAYERRDGRNCLTVVLDRA
jgi:serine/threonine-protein kinase RsbW